MSGSIWSWRFRTRRIPPAAGEGGGAAGVSLTALTAAGVLLRLAGALSQLVRRSRSRKSNGTVNFRFESGIADQGGQERSYGDDESRGHKRRKMRDVFPEPTSYHWADD